MGPLKGVAFEASRDLEINIKEPQGMRAPAEVIQGKRDGTREHKKGEAVEERRQEGEDQRSERDDTTL